jgi:sugar phosphate isomerase/epimerase
LTLSTAAPNIIGKMLKISIASYSFHGLKHAGMIDVFGYLETVRHRYQLDAADIWNGLLGDDPEVYLADNYLRKIKEALNERRLALVNYHADGCHIWEDDPALREKHYKLATRHLNAAAYLGARTVRIDSGGRERHWNDAQFDLIVKRYREFSDFGANHGFRVGPETHWGTELYADNMEKLARAVNHKNYGILLHLGRDAENKPDEFDRRLAPWTMHTHVDPNTIQTRLDSAIRTLLDAGYQGYWSTEHGEGKDEYAIVANQLTAVRSALSKVQEKQT